MHTVQPPPCAQNHHRSAELRPYGQPILVLTNSNDVAKLYSQTVLSAVLGGAAWTQLCATQFWSELVSVVDWFRVGQRLRLVVIAIAASLLGGCLHGGLPGRVQDVERTVALDIKDGSFGARKIPVRSGETVRFVIRNRSSQAHDFAIGTPYKQEMRRRRLQSLSDAGMTGPEYHDLPEYQAFNAVYVPPGATRELVWWFNSSEELEFASNVPGHYERGKRGVFVFSSSIDEPQVAEERRKRSLANVLPVANPKRIPRDVAPAPENRDLPADDVPVAGETDEPVAQDKPAEPETARVPDEPVEPETTVPLPADDVKTEEDKVEDGKPETAKVDEEAQTEVTPDAPGRVLEDEPAIEQETTDPEVAEEQALDDTPAAPAEEAPSNETPVSADEDEAGQKDTLRELEAE